ncbi:MAG: PD-(D/E)XK nuclease family protein [Candidatus Aenigmarchaeota archaeon]|nr:PD-(D/E)XK nuclease family protein [Candidatus Aenigmarchaeota archaeon]
MAIRGISPSLIEEYNRCPMQLYFSRILEPKPDVPEWIGKVFGDAIHYFISTYIYKETQYPLGFKSKKNMIKFWCYFWSQIMNGDDKIFKRKIGEVWYRQNELPEDLKKKGIYILSRYWDDNINLPRPLFVELKIEIPYNGVHLIGVIDQIRINPETGKHVIVDLKTGKTYGDSDREQFSLRTNIQLTFYAMLYRMYFDVEEDCLAIYDLNQGKMMMTKRDDKDILFLQDILRKIIDNISNANYKRVFGKHCSMCDYQEPCYKPEQYFTGERELTDDQAESIIFSHIKELSQQNLQISNRERMVISKLKPKQKKPKQLKLKLR